VGIQVASSGVVRIDSPAAAASRRPAGRRPLPGLRYIARVVTVITGVLPTRPILTECGLPGRGATSCPFKTGMMPPKFRVETRESRHTWVVAKAAYTTNHAGQMARTEDLSTH
jgi:hypothetical protein